MHIKGITCWLPLAGLLLASPAQSANDASHYTLQQAFEAAWALQPESASADAFEQASQARRKAAQSWLADGMSLELSTKGDQLNRNQGEREHEAGLAMPLWLPGERSRSGALADAQAQANGSRYAAARLRTAGEVRQQYWQWLLAAQLQSLASDRVEDARRLADDVERRVRAGEQAQTDRQQAQAALAQVELELSEADSTLEEARLQFQALTGSPLPARASSAIVAEASPDAEDERALASHPRLTELADQAEAAQRQAELAGVQSRGNPELRLTATNARDDSRARYDQSLTLGLSIPLGSPSRQRAQRAQAEGEAIEALVQKQRQQELLGAELRASRLKLKAAQQRAEIAEQRASLLQSSRAAIEKSYRLGESGLPDRLRIEAEAREASRQAVIARLTLARENSMLRQALGLLPQ
ncbi:TolC family protein [Pseudomonas sp. ABC1]|uniref:TolC family protein n=1 Tax=Pseudomonas sp. ABC1 TaxID=2748080 RepID=UPI0015C3FE9E|nr:TolC family protein [Pseudomonas sp. ABC1]QLF92415.1 TolC family protein [Pseudomonas sp. ABC1]